MGHINTHVYQLWGRIKIINRLGPWSWLSGLYGSIPCTLKTSHKYACYFHDYRNSDNSPWGWNTCDLWFRNTNCRLQCNKYYVISSFGYSESLYNHPIYSIHPIRYALLCCGKIISYGFGWYVYSYKWYVYSYIYIYIFTHIFQGCFTESVPVK